MRSFFLILLILILPTLTWAQTDEGGDTETPPPASVVGPSLGHFFSHWMVGGRGGVLLTPGDPQVEQDFSHNLWQSLQGTVGAYYRFPPRWREFYFFAGLEMSWYTSHETLSSPASYSTIVTNSQQVLGTFGANWEPRFLGGNWGISYFNSLELWGQRQSTLTTTYFSRSLGYKVTDTSWAKGVSIFYKITPQWRPYVNFEVRQNAVNTAIEFLSVGLNYAF